MQKHMTPKDLQKASVPRRCCAAGRTQMNTWKKTAVVLGLALAGWLGASRAEAVGVGTPSYLNIDVTINANLSVSVNDANSSTSTAISWNVALGSTAFTNAASSVTVTNDSGAQTERWQLSTNANSIDNTGGGVQNWTVATSSRNPGADQFSVQAVFGSSNTIAGGCPAAGTATWDSTPVAPLLTSTPVTYTATTFAAPALNNDGTPNPDSASPNPGEMFAASKRALCWQVVTPDSTSTTHAQNIQIIVTAQAP